MPDLDVRYQKLIETLEWLDREAEALLVQLKEQQYLSATTFGQLAVLQRLTEALADREKWGD